MGKNAKTNVNTANQIVSEIRSNRSLFNKVLTTSKKSPFLCKKPKKSENGKIVVRAKRLLPPSLMKILGSGATAAAIARQNKLSESLRSDTIKEKRGAPALINFASAAKTTLDLYAIALGCSLIARANAVREELSTVSRINAVQAEIAVAALARALTTGGEMPIHIPALPVARTSMEEEVADAKEEAEAEADEAEAEADLQMAEEAEAAAGDDDTAAEGAMDEEDEDKEGKEDEDEASDE